MVVSGAVLALGYARHAHDKMEKVSETWLRDEEDWAEHTTGSLVKELRALPPGERSYWQGAAAGTRFEDWSRWVGDKVGFGDYEKWVEENANRIDDANTYTRYLITKAYLSKMTDLPQKENEGDQQYNDRFVQFQRDQIAFMRDRTQGSFEHVAPVIYYDAHTHAELTALSRQLKESGQVQTIQIRRSRDGGSDYFVEFDLSAYVDFKGLRDRDENDVSPGEVIKAYQMQQKQVTLLQLNMLKALSDRNPENMKIQENLLRQAFLKEVRHQLATADHRILNTNFEGWDLTGGEQEGETLARYVLSAKLQELIRKRSDHLRTMEKSTVDEFEKSVAELEKWIATEPLELQRIGESGDYNDVEQYEENPNVLTDYHWILSRLVS